MSTVEAGWYSDPWEDGKIRYWDGTAWTDEQYDAEDSEHEVHGAEDPTPPVDHTVAPSSVLQAGRVDDARSVAPAQEPTQGGGNAGYAAASGGSPSARSAPGYGQMPSAQSAPGYGPGGAQQTPGYGQMPSAQSAPGYGPGGAQQTSGYGQMPSAQSAPGYGPGGVQQTPGYGQMPSAQSAPGYGPGGVQQTPGYGPQQGQPGAMQHGQPYGQQPGQPYNQHAGGGASSTSGWSAGSGAEAGWTGQTGPGFYSLHGAGSPSSTGPIGRPGPTAGDGYGGYPAAGAGSYPSGGSAPFGQSAEQAWAGSPGSAPAFGMQGAHGQHGPGPGGFGPGGYGPGGPGPSGYGGPGPKRSGVSPLVLALIGLVVLAGVGIGSYFLFFSGDDTATTPGGSGQGTVTDPVPGQDPAPGPVSADALSFVDSGGAAVPADGTIQIPSGDSAWTGTVTVTERTGFVVIAAFGETDPEITLTGPGVDINVDDVASAYRGLTALGGDSSRDAVVGTILEPGTYSVEVTDWYGTGGSTTFAFRSGLAGTLTHETPLAIDIPAGDIVLLEARPGSNVGSVRTESASGTDPRLIIFPTTGQDEYNDDGRSSAPSSLGSGMDWNDAYVETDVASQPALVVVSTWLDVGGTADVVYADR